MTLLPKNKGHQLVPSLCWTNNYKTDDAAQSFASFQTHRYIPPFTSHPPDIHIFKDATVCSHFSTVSVGKMVGLDLPT